VPGTKRASSIESKDDEDLDSFSCGWLPEIYLIADGGRVIKQIRTTDRRGSSGISL